MTLGWEIVLVLVFVLVGGVFSMSELALVSLRDSQVRTMRAVGARGSAAVERLRGNTNRFLSAVQIGVTLAGFFASAFGGATIAARLTPVLEGWGLAPGLASTLSLVLVTIVVSYLSLVLGELVPKRIALQKPEKVSGLVAGPLEKVATITRPVIWLLGVSTNVVVRLVGLDPKEEREEVSEEELREMVSSHETLSADERRVLGDVFAAADRRISEVMIPRTEVDFLSGDMDLEQAVSHVERRAHSRYPVTGEGVDDVIGFVHVRDLLTALRHPEMTRPDGRTGDRRTVLDVMRPVTLMTGGQSVLPALGEMQRTRRHIAVIVDEYGGTDGIVTLEDLVEELVGEIEDEHDRRERPAPVVKGEVEVSGLLHRDEVLEQVGVQLPEGQFETLGGFVMAQLGRLPGQGDSVEVLERRFTVTALDGRRPDRVLVEHLVDDPDGSRPRTEGAGGADALTGVAGDTRAAGAPDAQTRAGSGDHADGGRGRRGLDG